MTTRSKLVLLGLTATLLMGLAVSSASAGRLSISNSRVRFTWSPLTFRSTEDFIVSLLVRCPVTFEGSFHSATIQKVNRSLIGYISRATANSGACTGGRVTFLQEQLPWHITFEGFTGALPLITAIRLLIRRHATLIEASGLTCLYTETGASKTRMSVSLGAGGVVTGAEYLPEFTIPSMTGFPCSGAIRPEGTASVTLLGNTSAITIRLI